VRAPAAASVLIVGGGVAGGLLALALREQGVAVSLVDGPAPQGGWAASAISYGALPGWPLAATPLARLAAGASRRWRWLQQRHGPLGWRPLAVHLHGGDSGWRSARARLPLPFAQVDAGVLAARLPQVLAAAGVTLHSGWVEQLEAGADQAWQLQRSNGSGLQAQQVVLAAGAHARGLWPALPPRLRSSWAAVLALEAYPAALPGGGAWLPARFGRVDLERRAAALTEPEWLVDGGLVPSAGGALLGQHTLVRPQPEPGLPPDPVVVEDQLRQALAPLAWGAPLAGLPGPLRQAPVAFCTGGLPLVGPAADAPGLWLFTGFSAGIAQVPVLAPLLAARIAGPAAAAQRAEQRLRQLGVWPTPA